WFHRHDRWAGWAAPFGFPGRWAARIAELSGPLAPCRTGTRTCVLPAAIGVEDGVVQVCERLVAPKLDRAGHDRILLGELRGDRATEEEGLHDVQPTFGPAGCLAGPLCWLS